MGRWGPPGPQRILCALGAARALAYSPGTPLENLTEERRGAPLVDPARLPLRTQGRYITDKWGERVKWACVNWYGAYSTRHAVGGLEVRPMRDIVDRIVGLGFNCVRAMYSVEGYVENPVVADDTLLANPELQGKRFLELFDLHIQMMTDVGLMVIVNNHNSKSGWCCHYSQDEGLWYTPEYSEEQWIESLVFFANRYKHNRLVVAIDLRNEVHDYDGTHLTWGGGDPKTDWALAATVAGNKVLETNPDVLIVVMAMCFGADLRPMRRMPIQLMYPNRVVYETHNYLEYQIFDNISKILLPWKELRSYVLFLAVIFVSIVVFQRQAWKFLGKPLPPLGALLVSAGFWTSFFSLVGLTIATKMRDFAMLFCAFSADVDFMPWVVGFAVTSALSIVSVALGVVLLLLGLGGVGGQLQGPETRRQGRRKLYEMSPLGNPVVVAAQTYGRVRARPEVRELEDLDCSAASRRAASPAAAAERSPASSLPATPSAAASGADWDAGRAVTEAAEAACAPVRCRCCDLCCVPGFGTCLRVYRDIPGVVSSILFRQAPRPPAEWDCGLCVGLQVFILLLILISLFLAAYICAHLIPTYNFAAWHFDRMWGFALKDGYDFTAPVWMGEFGQEARGTYWLNFVRYLSSRDADFAYWAINGLKWKEGEVNVVTGNFEPWDPLWDEETFGILSSDYWSIRHTWKLLDLTALMASPSTWRPADHPCDYEVDPACGG